MLRSEISAVLLASMHTAQNEAASWSTLVPGQSQAENTSEMTQGSKAIYAHEGEVLEQQRHSLTASHRICVSGSSPIHNQHFSV